jgi:hypothetical protein
MEPNLMNLHTLRLWVFREVQQEFQARYPFLKVDFVHKTDDTWINGLRGKKKYGSATTLLDGDIGLSDETSVAELETALREWFGNAVHVLRRNGESWMETSKTRDWTLRLQNDQGRDISEGLPIN